MVVLGGHKQSREVDASVSSDLSRSEAEGRNLETVDILNVKFKLGKSIFVFRLNDSGLGDLKLVTQIGLCQFGNVEALSLSSFLPRDTSLRGQRGPSSAIGSAVDGPINRIVLGSIPTADDAVLVGINGSLVREDDRNPASSNRVVNASDPTGINARVESSSSGAITKQASVAAVGSFSGKADVGVSKKTEESIELEVVGGGSRHLHQSNSDRHTEVVVESLHRTADGSHVVGLTATNSSGSGSHLTSRYKASVDLLVVDVDHNTSSGVEMEFPALHVGL